MTSPDLEIHIEELVLYGFTTDESGKYILTEQTLDSARISAAVQSELTHLFAERGVSASLAHSGEVASLDGGEFHVTPGSNAQVIGSQVAQAVYRRLSR
jgi:hypothetical protein